MSFRVPGFYTSEYYMDGALRILKNLKIDFNLIFSANPVCALSGCFAIFFILLPNCLRCLRV